MYPTVQKRPKAFKRLQLAVVMLIGLLTAFLWFFVTILQYYVLSGNLQDLVYPYDEKTLLNWETMYTVICCVLLQVESILVQLEGHHIYCAVFMVLNILLFCWCLDLATTALYLGPIEQIFSWGIVILAGLLLPAMQTYSMALYRLSKKATGIWQRVEREDA